MFKKVMAINQRKNIGRYDIEIRMIAFLIFIDNILLKNNESIIQYIISKILMV